MTAADTPDEEPSLSRRSRRRSQATLEAAPLTRAQLRQRLLAEGIVPVNAEASTNELEAIVEAVNVGETSKAALIVEPEGAADPELKDVQAAPAVVQLSRRARRLETAPVAQLAVADGIAESAVDEPAASESLSDSVSQTSVPAEAVGEVTPPLRRRDRRRPVVDDVVAAVMATETIVESFAAPVVESAPQIVAEDASSAPLVPEEEEKATEAIDTITPVDVAVEAIAEADSRTPVTSVPDVEILSPRDVPPVENETDRVGGTGDAFTRAVEAFRFDGVVPPIKAAPPLGATIEIPAAVPSRRLTRFRAITTMAASLSVLGITSAITVSMTTPALAVGAQAPAVMAPATQVPDGEWGTDFGPEEGDAGEIQAYVASEDVENAEVTRTDDFTVASSRQAAAQIAAESGIRYSTSLYTNDTSADIQWPFPVGVAMSSPYGMRWGRMHQGIDLVPGNGAPIQAISAGTVRIATENGGAYGVNVYIDHEIDGQIITSHYAHMQYGSLRVRAGDKVKVGDMIGRTGNTGRSYGAHLHFEIAINGKIVDPLPWMKANAGRYFD